MLAIGHTNVLWVPDCPAPTERCATMNDAMTDPGASFDPMAFDAWCDCVRRLLDWSDGVGEGWAVMFAAGQTPRDAARMTIYGDTVGD